MTFHVRTRSTRTPRPIELPAELDRLTPRTNIPDLLAEVQNWTGFTSHSTHAAYADPGWLICRNICTPRCSLGA